MRSEMSELTKGLAKAILPLRRKEELAAVNAARDHVAKDLSDHYRILGAELRIDKPSDPKQAPLRMIGVLIVDYGNRRNFEVLVDGKGKAVRVVDLHGAQPAYKREEIQEAREIAQQDSRVDRFAKMRGSFVSEFGPATSRLTRCLLNEFLKEHHQVQDLKAIVAEQQKQIERLTSGLRKVSEQVTMAHAGTQTVAEHQ